MVGVQLGWIAHLGAPIARGERVTKQAPPPGTWGSFSKCFYLLHLYPLSVPVVFACSAQSVQRCALPRPPLHTQTHRNNRTNPHYYDRPPPPLYLLTTDGLLPCAVFVVVVARVTGWTLPLWTQPATTVATRPPDHRPLPLSRPRRPRTTTTTLPPATTTTVRVRRALSDPPCPWVTPSVRPRCRPPVWCAEWDCRTCRPRVSVSSTPWECYTIR